MSDEGFICRVCGQTHEDAEFSFAADLPDMYANLSEVERARRALIGTDQCVIDEQWFFIRGCLEVPIINSEEVFLWGLWVSVTQRVFDEFSAFWEEDGREHRHGPFKGRLANSLSVYPETFNVMVEIRVQAVGKRPLFVVEEEGHDLQRLQRDGMSRRDAIELTAQLVHLHGPSSGSVQ